MKMVVAYTLHDNLYSRHVSFFISTIHFMNESFLWLRLIYTFSLLAQLKSCRKHKQTTVDTDVNVETESKKCSRVEPGSFSFTKICKQFFCTIQLRVNLKRLINVFLSVMFR